MPRIGQRIVKSALAVFLCFIVFMVRGSGMPFYSAIAAVLCMQPEMEDSWSKGKSRCMGTILGGVVGMVVLALFQRYVPYEEDWLRYVCISILIIPLIYSSLLLKQTSSSYLSCVVFMSITISHIGDASPYIFALNRMLDTMIGILIALLVNAFHLPRKKHKNVLIEIPLEQIMHNNKIDTRTAVHVNACIDRGAHLLFTTSHAPSVTLTILHRIHSPSMCLCMDGVLTYDIDTQSCRALYALPALIWQDIIHALTKINIYPFLYEIRDEVLYVHYQDFHNEEMHMYYKTYYKQPQQRYVYHEKAMDMNCDIIAMKMLIKQDQYETTLRILEPFMAHVTCISFPHKHGYCMVKVYPQAVASVDISAQIAAEMGLNRVIKIRKEAKEERVEAQIKKIEYAFYKGKETSK